MLKPTRLWVRLSRKNKELNSKLVVKERARLSTEAGLKNAQDQAEDQ